MNCQRFREILPSLVKSQDRVEGDHQVAVSHAAQCTGCAALLEGEKALSMALQTIAEEDRQMTVPQEVGERLQISFRGNFAPNRKSQFSGLRPVWMKAAAIVAVIVGALLWFQMRPQHSVSDLARPTLASPSMRSSEGLSNAPTIEEEPARSLAQESKEADASGKGKHSEGVPDSGDEVATEFFPLSPSDEAYGSLQRVRVKLPRDSLMQFGLPMNSERAEEPIVADLLVGEDGTPRAIRFVQDFQ